MSDATVVQNGGHATAKKEKGRGTGFYVRATFFFAFLFFLYGPIVVMGILSFQGPTGGMTFPMRGFSLHWFREVFNPSYIGEFTSPFLLSIGLAVVVMVITTVLSFLAGLAYRRGFKGSGIVFYLTVASLVTPSFLISIGIGLGFSNLGLQTDAWTGGLGAQLTWTLPFGLLIMLAIFSRLDTSIEEMARDLGATDWQRLQHVVIPIVLPGLIAVALFGFTLSYDEFPRTALLVGSNNTLPVEMLAVQSIAPRPNLYAVGTMTTIFSLAVITISFVALWLVEKRRGLTGGGGVPEAEHYGDALGQRRKQVGPPAE